MSHPLGKLITMKTHFTTPDLFEDSQLFYTPQNDFRIDERTKAIGRQGIAAARAKLAAISEDAHEQTSKYSRPRHAHTA